MPKASKRAGFKRRPTPNAPPEYFIFEIGEFQPTYILSVDHDRYRKYSYSEHAGIEFEGKCVFPEKLVGSTVSFILAGQRDFLTPDAFKQDSSWKPRCIGALEIRPERASFYTAVPIETLPFLTTAFAHREVRYVLLYGEPLSRGKSLCVSMQFEKCVNLEDY